MQNMESNSKRKSENEADTSEKIKKVENCVDEASTSQVCQSAKPETMLEKLKNAAPYNLFFTAILKSPETLRHPNAIVFTDLLCPTLGHLKCSLQVNFIVDVDWLMKQYEARNFGEKPLTILYDERQKSSKDSKCFKNVARHHVKMLPYGTHHSKVGIYVYEDNSLRVVVSTANLFYEDWNHYNQGIWVSPSCPPLSKPSEKSGDSPTGFKSCLLSYLRHYDLPILKLWIDYVESADFSDIKVFLVTSVPGYHFSDSPGSHVNHVGQLLSQHCSLPAETEPDNERPLSWAVIAQASSIGSLGKTSDQWLISTLLRNLAGYNQTQLDSNLNATLKVIFPTEDNVKKGYFGADSGHCLSYSTHEKQTWLQEYLHKWKADELCRSEAMPHIKTYCRVSPCLSKLAWFLMTSANISKAAWGGNMRKDKKTYVKNYEVGVMFLPKFFDEEYFEIPSTLNHKNNKLFPFIYDLPLTEYASNDCPFPGVNK